MSVIGDFDGDRHDLLVGGGIVVPSGICLGDSGNLRVCGVVEEGQVNATDSDSLLWAWSMLAWGEQVEGEELVEHGGAAGQGGGGYESHGGLGADSDGVRSAQEWEALVCSAPFTFPCEWSLEVIQCESSGNPNAYNPAGPHVGLWQVLNGVTDPLQNTIDAHIQFKEWMAGIRQESPWPTCPRGMEGIRP